MSQPYTHVVENQAQRLLNYNSWEQDPALQQAVRQFAGSWGIPELQHFGSQCGSAERIALGFAANRYLPEFQSHDERGFPLQRVNFHPSYHQLMTIAMQQQLHSAPWAQPRAGAHVVRAAKYYLHSQVEAGHGCPITMTFAAIPVIEKYAKHLPVWLQKALQSDYDATDRPVTAKSAVTFGMAMTEKQGGSDVRANTTVAKADGDRYRLTGHKWFMSAPMSDAFLTLAQTEAGLSCFLVPRRLDNGELNGIVIQRLKDKVGNRSNASSEVEFNRAQGWLLGEQGKGVNTIIEMVAITRYDCMIGSAAGMRQAVSQAIHHCRQRRAFGELLVNQPLMLNVLADLALESEAAMALSMRMAYAFDQREDKQQQLLIRIATAIGKYWICKQAPQHAYEAMECLGGNGVVELDILARIYREAPINAIWEGSGNIQCLDVMRALHKSPETVTALFDELDGVDNNQHYTDAVNAAKQQLQQAPDASQLRRTLELLAKLLQARQLARTSPDWLFQAFCNSRLAPAGFQQYGCLPESTPLKAIVERAFAAL
ncbi:DNA alkylation response protein [Idiomarina tyrosinivorans]|uniref:DNA alkylation response protein n=1 Tax=Idiomarina tyrosinivorans TaxID=1445662 RepID=A0A432ZUG3_9GAMM|nr:acyl-CoA dehydrogenase family protein [Idiomarina tyrosinivorans]RUO81448.1 DNA alkylation response protein [Idiomarina tyrosinivorans]